MTTSMEGRPAGFGSPPGADSYVVRPDRPAADRLLRIQVVCLAVLVLLGALRVAFERGWMRPAWAVIYVLWIPTMAFQLVVWSRFRSAEALAAIGPGGIRVNVLSRRGWATLPWNAVGSVRKDIWGRIVVRPAEGVDESTPGTEWPPTSRWQRRRPKKLYLMTRASDAAPNQVLAAVTHLSGGRL